MSNDTFYAGQKDYIAKLNEMQTQITDVANIAAVQINSDWNATNGYAEILNKPTIPSTTDQIVEGTSATNLYYTDARVRMAALTGLNPTLDADLTASDNVLSAFSKLQKRLSNILSSVAGKISSSLMGAANGVATLDSTGRLPSAQLPSNLVTQAYVDGKVVTMEAAGTPISVAPKSLNFTGPLVQATSSSDNVTVNVSLSGSNVTNALGYTPIDSGQKAVANGVATLDAGGRLPSAQLPTSVATTDSITAAQITVKGEGVSVTGALRSLDFEGSSIHTVSDSNNNVTVTVDTVNVVSVNATMGSAIVSGYSLVVNCSGAAGLQGQSIASFVVTPSWAAQQTVPATGGNATVSIPVTGSIGTNLSVNVVAVDTAGNRSMSLTKTASITADSAPVGTPIISAPTVIPKTATASISFSGVQDNVGVPFSFTISQTGQTWPFTFSKTSGIAPGETVIVTAPDTTGVTSDPATTFSVYAVDALGLQGVPSSCSITIIASTVTGVVLKATGGGGGTWGQIDVNGNDVTTSPSTWFDSYAPYNWQTVTVAGRSMVKIPKFYFKTGVISGGVNNGLSAWWISDLPRYGFTVHPAFMKNGAEISQFYIDAGPPNGNNDAYYANAVSAAAALNTGGVTGFQLMDIWQWSAILYAALIEKQTMANVAPFIGSANNNLYRNVTLIGPYDPCWVDGFYIDQNGHGFVFDTSGNRTYIDVGAMNVGTTGAGFGQFNIIQGYGTGNYAMTFVATSPLNAGFFGNTASGAVSGSSATNPGAIAMKTAPSGMTYGMVVPYTEGSQYTNGTVFSYDVAWKQRENTYLTANMRYSKT